VAINLTFSLLFTESFSAADLSEFSLGLFLLTILVSFVPWFGKAFRLNTWLKLTDEKHMGFKEVFRVTLLSELGAAISPTAIGAGPIKATLLSRKKLTVGESVSIMSIAPIEDIVLFSMAMPLLFLISPSLGLHSFPNFSINFATIGWWIAGVSAFIFLTVFISNTFFGHTNIVQKVRKWFREFWSDFFDAYNLMIRHGKFRFILNVCIGTVQWTARYSLIPLLMMSLGFEVNFIQFYILYFMMAFLASFIPTPGATGAAEGAFLLVFSNAIPSSALGLIMIGWRFLSFYLYNIFAIIVVYIIEFKTRKPAPVPETPIPDPDSANV
jgi:hypothetical protein